MKLVRGIHNIMKCHHRCMLTIGNFDSVHLGHRELLNLLRINKYRFKIPTMVMIFEPQPLEFILGIKSPTRLYPLRDKIKKFFEYEIDYLLCVNFNNEFSSLSPNSFISKILVNKLKIKSVIIGDDFHFGKDRTGDFYLLCKKGKQYGFHVSIFKEIQRNGERVSSTSIRKALSNGNLLMAENLMGHPYKLSGKVVYGKQFGRTIGFPTANIFLRNITIPLNGVYIVNVYGILKEKSLQAIANIGIRPTFNGDKQRIEVHLIDVRMNIYGMNIDILFRKKLRNEIKFSSIENLVKQILKDIDETKKFFRSN
ncbi:FMN adenylyltransferase [Candidatus Riesia sp. GBBU]|nr:FMN adenylyltransferase [Candidatus Riesia sp. GBBU]ARC55067.1 FMN adenylyltransferase [Candidatus Riesia sp. GBBU]